MESGRYHREKKSFLLVLNKVEHDVTLMVIWATYGPPYIQWVNFEEGNFHG